MHFQSANAAAPPFCDLLQNLHKSIISQHVCDNFDILDFQLEFKFLNLLHCPVCSSFVCWRRFKNNRWTVPYRSAALSLRTAPHQSCRKTDYGQRTPDSGFRHGFWGTLWCRGCTFARPPPTQLRFKSGVSQRFLSFGERHWKRRPKAVSLGAVWLLDFLWF